MESTILLVHQLQAFLKVRFPKSNPLSSPPQRSALEQAQPCSRNDNNDNKRQGTPRLARRIRVASTPHARTLKPAN
jgi:hypothetical protein